MKNQANIKKRKMDRKLIFYIGFMVFPLAQFLIFYIGVNFQSILMTFQEYDTFKTEYNFRKADAFLHFKEIWWNRDSLWIMLKNSLIVWGYTSLAGTVLAVLFSYYIYKRSREGKFFKFMLFIPSILPAILLSSVFQNFSNTLIPAWMDGKKLLHIVDSPLKTQFNTAIFYTVWAGFGSQILLYTVAMEQISPSVIEAGQLDGAKPLREFWSIVLPSIMSTVGTFLVAGVATVFTQQASLFNFFSEKADVSVQTLGYHMFSRAQSRGAESEFPYLSALGLVCTLLAIVPTLLLRKYFARYED